MHSYKVLPNPKIIGATQNYRGHSPESNGERTFILQEEGWLSDRSVNATSVHRGILPNAEL